MEIPGYEIKRTIGRGGMGTAYLAVQESLGREVVLKTLNASYTEDSAYFERFLNEGRIVAALNHPHIITIFDIGATEDAFYISMEYVEGGDLKSRIYDGMTPDAALDVICKIAGALALAHGKGIIHRDVKPANILFRNDGTPLLTDFGIAKQLQVDSELTSTGTILGSPFYMSPEQSEGLKVDGRTDIYAVGIIFYEMLTGQRPFVGDSAIKVIVQHIQSPLPTLPNDLKRYQPLLNSMLAKNRDERFPDAATLVEQVNELQAENEAVALADSVGASTGEHSKPGGLALLFHNNRVAGLLAGVVVLLLAYTGFYFYTQTLTESGLVAPRSEETPSTINVASVPPTTTELPADTVNLVDGSGPPKKDVVQALQWLAKTSLEEGRLTDPPADNAYYYYSRLLALDPSNRRARLGFAQIAERYVVLAEKEFAQKNYRQAQTYITLGLQVQPDNKGLRDLQSFMDNRERSMLESISDFFKGSG
jgi:serine/threonine protein kinase